jgi:STE24 endopeptidase
LDRQFPHLWDGAPWLVNAAAMLSLVVVIVVMPLLIYLALGLRPLPEGLLRERLLTATRRLGFRCTNLLVWDTRHGMANAMVIGLVPWLRFVVFTDRLLEEFTEEEVEAVLGHEIGHIRHHHMLTYLIFLMLSLAVLGAFADHFLLPWLGEAFDSLAQRFPMLPESVGEWLGPGGFLSPLPVVVLILLYIFGVFGFLSRQCERQADIFGCRATSCAEQPCPGHSEATTLPRGGVGLCRTGIHTFIRALDKVALINGISRDRPGFLQSWQHSTIARRVEFLHGLLRDPAQEAVFQRRLLAIKVVLLLGSGLMLAWLVHGHGWQL